MANPVGRPRTTIDDLPEGWQDTVMLLGQEGKSAVQIRCKLGIGMSAWETLLEDSPEFRETIKNAKDLCECWWEDRGQEMSKDGIGNATVWIFNMKNRFGWQDKSQTELTGANGEPIQQAITIKVDFGDGD